MTGDSCIEDLLGGETDRIEYKESIGNRDGILRAVAALANDLGDSGRPGHLLVGVDKRGTVTGIDRWKDDADEQQRQLADLVRSTKLQPQPSVSIGVVPVAGQRVIAIQVAPYPVPPIVEVDGQAWVRVGSTTRLAHDADLQRLRERRPESRQPFDTRPLPGARLDDLELGPLRAEHASARELDDDPGTFPAFEDWLVQRELGRRVHGVFAPNAAGVLLHGRSPQDHLPGAFLDLVRYGGIDHNARVVARRTATGTLGDQLDVAWSWLSSHTEDQPVRHGAMQESFVPNFPVDALKELVRNLVQHRLYDGTNAPGRVEWFDDRIEFSNPGGPFGRASEGEFGQHSDYRNPLVTRGLVRLGYVQQLGRGVRRTRALLERNGNPPLEVEVDGFTRVVVRRRP